VRDYLPRTDSSSGIPTTDTAYSGGIWASQPNMDLPVDEPGVYRVALAVVCNQEKQEAKDKLIASILAGKVSLHQPLSALTHDTDPLILSH
jgi:hypothetical protein